MVTRNHGPRTRRRGFSLVELVLAIALVAVAGGILLLTVQSSRTGTERAREWDVAGTLARNALDTLRDRGFPRVVASVGETHEIPLGRLAGDPGATDPEDSGFRIAGQEYAGTFEVSPLSRGLAMVTVRIHWKRDGASRSFPLVGVVAARHGRGSVR